MNGDCDCPLELTGMRHLEDCVRWRQLDGRGCPSATPLGGDKVEDQRKRRKKSKATGAVAKLRKR